MSPLGMYPTLLELMYINSPNSIKKIPGEGMPLSKDPSKHGDLIIKFATSYPAYLTNEQKALLRKAFN